MLVKNHGLLFFCMVFITAETVGWHQYICNKFNWFHMDAIVRICSQSLDADTERKKIFDIVKYNDGSKPGKGGCRGHTPHAVKF